MKIVRIDGGLGNQLFQYAFYCYLCDVSREKVYVDVNCFNPHQSRDMFSLFDIKPCPAPAGKVRYFHRNGIWHLLRPTDRLGITKPRYLWDRDLGSKDVKDIKNAYFRGYWQIGMYAEKEKERLTAECKPMTLLEHADEAHRNRNLELLKEIENTQSVGVHFRGGDYLENDAVYGGCCTKEYYQRALEMIRQEIPEAKFYFFTNDPVYLKNIGLKTEGHIVDLNDEEWGHLDLLLMSRCKHRIMANSSFSWWASWFHTEEDGMVLMPSMWERERKSDELRIRNWRLI